MTNAAFLAAALTLAAQPALASDFSRLGDPAFARTLLLGQQRTLEATCASIAIHRPQVVGNVAPRDAQVMGDLVAQRLIDEIGVEKDAREFLEDRAGWFDSNDFDSTKSKKLKAEVLANFARKCAPLLDSYRTGGKAGFEATLLPSRGLIPLLSLPRCIALTEYVSARDPHAMFDKEQLAEVNEIAHHGLSEGDRKSLDSAIGAERATLAKSKPDPDVLAATPMACLATFRQRAEQAYPERF